MKQYTRIFSGGLIAMFLFVTAITKVGYAASPEPAASEAGNAAHGKQLYSKSCASCHGAIGNEGAIGPSLKNEKAKKNADQLVTFMKTNAGPMPRLYPSPLSDGDVSDLVAYMNTL